MKVTVLMPVYNGEQHLREAIDSILGQSFTDFEFLIIDDGSKDASAEIAASYRDPRIRLLRNGQNSGLIFTLNRGLEAANGEFIARMDCDDVSLPERLARQVAFLESHPEVGVCGSWFRKFGAGPEKTLQWSTSSESIRCGLLFDSMLGHPTVMLRRKLVGDFGLCYDPAYKNAEDYELWVRAAQHCELANLGEVLLRYRVHPGQVTQSQAAGQRDTAGKVRLALLRGMGIEPSRGEMEIHQAIATCCCDGIGDLFARAEAWLCKLKTVNDEARIYPEPAFSRMLMERWLVFCKKAVGNRHLSLKPLYFPKLMKKTGLGSGFLINYFLQHLAGR
ncbi:MAG TPA: glycosyltransferase [Geomonas sp.]|nr:glycosyltransferase [Geomonas sp.]